MYSLLPHIFIERQIFLHAGRGLKIYTGIRREKVLKRQQGSAISKVAATMAAETMNGANDLKKLRNDVLQQGLASLAAFIGGVNYSSSFSMAAAAASKGHNSGRKVPIAMATAVNEDEVRDPSRNEKGPSAPLADELENPIYNAERMQTDVEHANQIAKSYGVTIMSINIISCRPVDATLTKTLASGAVAAAEALQAETAAQGRATAKLVESKAEADACVLKRKERQTLWRS